MRFLISLLLGVVTKLCVSEEDIVNSIEVGMEETNKSLIMERLRVQSYPTVIDIPVESVRPPGMLREAAPVTSAALARLELSPASRLHGSPGGNVNVDFLLTNADKQQRYFAIDVISHGSPGAVIFPGSFSSVLNERRIQLEPNHTKIVEISIMIPRDVPWGTNKTFTIRVQPEGVTESGPAELVTRRFYFTVGQPQNVGDEWAPECKVLRNTVTTECGDALRTTKQCDLYNWVGELEFQDTGSGLRSVSETPSFIGLTDKNFFSHDNFVIGSHLQAKFLAQVSCCITTIYVNVTDVFGNENICTVGLESARNGGVAKQEEILLGSTTSTVVIVVVALLILALFVAIGLVFYFKRKRNAELAEMRATPQER